MAIQNPKVPYILLVLIPVCVFLNSLHSGFVYDDIGVIEDNYFIRSLHNTPKIFSRDYFHLSNELSYRPVVTLSYFLDYAVWGIKPFGYHLTNVILHAITGVILYSLLLWLIRIRSVALLSSVLFSIHPCVTEAVNAISYREDIFVALFSLLSCLCLMKSGRRYLIAYPDTPPLPLSQQGKRGTSNRQPHRLASQWHRRIYYVLALTTYLIGLFSKETAIVTPLFILFFWFFCKRKNPVFPPSIGEGIVNPVSLVKPNDDKAIRPTKSSQIKDFLTYYSGYILVSLFYVLIRFVILKNPLEISPGYVKGSLAINFMTMTKILAAYVKLMFFPFRLSADYTISPVLSVFNFSFITSVFLLVAVGIIIFKTVKGIYGLFMLCFFVALLPVLNIIPIGHIMAERYLYFPVAGFCVVMSGLLLGKLTTKLSGNHPQSPYKLGKLRDVFEEKSKKFVVKKRFLQGKTALNKFFTLLFLSLVCIFFTTKTILRNKVWQNEYTFWTAILRKQPQNYDAHNNLGNYFYKQGKLDRAISELEEAVRLKKNYPEGHNSLGTMYIDKELIDKAIAEYVEAIKYKPVFPQAYYNLGNACIKKGLLDNGITYFQKAVSMGMHNPQVFNNLGSAYIKKGMLDEAIAQYKKALAVYNNYAEVHSNLGYVYTEKGDLDKAISELEAALELHPNHANAHNNLGAVYCQKGLFDKAQQEFLMAIKYDPKNASAHKNIGVVYFTKGDKQKAREHFLQMLQYDPNYIKDSNIFPLISELDLIKK